MATAKQTINAKDERGCHHWPLRAVLVAMMVAGVTAGMMAYAPAGVAADPSTRHNLKPGVRAGDIVITRRVEPALIGSVDHRAGPIASRVNVRDAGVATQDRLANIGIVSLSDDRAAGIRSSVQNSVGHVQGSGSDALVRSGGQGLGISSNRAASSLGGGGGAGGGIAGQVTSATSGIAGTVGSALSPLTGRK